jgi:hypothetical protein
MSERSEVKVSEEALFSKRHGITKDPEIKFRDDLPAELRSVILKLIRGKASAQFLRETMEELFNPYGLPQDASLRRPPLFYPLGENPVRDDGESERLLRLCHWSRVYDVVEKMFAELVHHESEYAQVDDEPRAQPLQTELHEFFRYAGIGWQMIDGKITARGEGAFENTVTLAQAELLGSGRATAADRIRKAIRNLSERPTPDSSGAISHATGALECVLSDVTGDQMTLGEYLNRHRQLFPSTMKKILEGIWGYSSQEGARHGLEGVEPLRDEAEFVVATASAAATYLSRKNPQRTRMV